MAQIASLTPMTDPAKVGIKMRKSDVSDTKGSLARNDNLILN
jgi:hypothetical protein